LNAITGRKRGGGAKRIDDGDHGFAIEHSGDVVGDGGNDLPASHNRKLVEEGFRQLPGDGCKRVSVKKQERCAAVVVAKEVDRFQQRRFPDML